MPICSNLGVYNRKLSNKGYGWILRKRTTGSVLIGPDGEIMRFATVGHAVSFCRHTLKYKATSESELFLEGIYCEWKP